MKNSRPSPGPAAGARESSHAAAPAAPAQAAQAAAPGPGRAVRLASLLALAAAIVAAFGGVVRNGWVMLDDADYVFANPVIARGLTLAGLRSVLVRPFASNWHPFTSAMHMVNVQLFGLAPGGHHAASLALHLAGALVLAPALHRLTGAWWRSLLVAALFALHPLRVESVAWASELKDVLSGLCFALVLWAYARWAERPGAGRLVPVAAALVLGLLAKPMLVTVPFVLVLLDVWPLGRLRGLPLAADPARPRGAAPARPLAGLFVEKWWMFALAAASSVVTFLVQHATGAVVAAGRLPLWPRVLNAACAYWSYLGMTFWPRGLVPFYPLGTVNPALALVALLALVAATALAFALARRRPWVLVGWLWYAGMLVPVIGLVQVGMQSRADRYTYLPGIGIAVLVAWGAEALLPRARAVRVAAAVAAVALLATLGVATARQVARWRTNASIFGYALSLDPGNVVAHQSIGSELLQTGHTREAIAHFEAALRTVPDYTDARMNLGSAFGALGQLDRAMDAFGIVMRERDNATVRRNAGLTLMRMGRADEAIADYEAALRFEPDQPRTLFELGAALGARGRLADADAALRRAVELAPADREARRLLAGTLVAEGSVEGAVAQYGELVREDAGDLDALNNIAWIRATHADAAHRDGAAAVRFAEQARDRSHEPVAVLYSTLAAAYAEAGRFPDAVRAGERAVSLAGVERDTAAVARYAQQLAGYRAGRAFHFAK